MAKLQRAEAEEILAQAKAQAEEILAQAQAQAGQIREEAKKEGFNSGTIESERQLTRKKTGIGTAACTAGKTAGRRL